MSLASRKPAPGTLRLRLACATEEEFLRRFSGQIASRGLFVPMASRPPPGTVCRLELSFQESGPRVLGEALVSRHARAGEHSGVMMRFTRLDPESVQFALGPLMSLTALEQETGALDAELAIEALRAIPGFDEKTRVAEVPTQLERRARPEPRPEPDHHSPTRLAETPASFDEAPEGLTRVHGYSSAELAASKDPEAWSGGLRPFDRIRNYQLIHRVGLGGMAEVFLSRCELGNGAEKLVALKMVLPEFGPGSPFATLFLNEARVSASLQHPNLVQVFDTGEAAGRGYLAMEYVHGRSLAAVIQRLRSLGEPPPLGLAISVGIELCQALEYLHTQRGLNGALLNLVHRDLSPGNILISDGGELKLVDFGVAAVSAESDAGELVVGKRAYMAPEQARGDSPSPSWDLYALGVVLYEMLTLEQLHVGHTPSGPTGRSPVEGSRKQRPPSSSNHQVPAALDQLVLWLTDRDPCWRAQNAASVRSKLEALRDQVPPCDLRQLMSSLFGQELRSERTEIERMVTIAHQRRGRVADPAEDGPLRHLTQIRRRVQTTVTWRRLTRHRQAAQWAFAGLCLHLFLLGPLFFLRHQQRERIARGLAELDARVQRAQLAGPGNDTALSALVELRRLAPNDPRLRERTRQLLALFLSLAETAEARGDLGEAAVHYQAALEADPSRDDVRARLEHIEETVRRNTASEAIPP